MILKFLKATTVLLLISASAIAQSDEQKAKNFFKNNLEQAAEDYVSARIEQSLSERFSNIEIDITDLDGEDTRFSIFTVQPIYDDLQAGVRPFSKAASSLWTIMTL